MMRTTSAFTALACLAGAAMAADMNVRLGQAEVRFDRDRWRASVIPEGLRFDPQGKSASNLDAVELHVRHDAPCRELAIAAFQFGHYDMGSLETNTMIFGGIEGERFEAHTGCRNATPRGVVACVKSGGRAYVLRSVNPGCEGRNLFSGIDPIAEIAAGITFTAPR